MFECFNKKLFFIIDSSYVSNKILTVSRYAQKACFGVFF